MTEQGLAELFTGPNDTVTGWMKPGSWVAFGNFIVIRNKETGMEKVIILRDEVDKNGNKKTN